jgi:hypothetical protein
MNFTKFWQLFNSNWSDGNYFQKTKLTSDELVKIQHFIYAQQKAGKPSTEIITALQSMNKKLNERWKAERAFWTELKRRDTVIVEESAEDLDMDEFTVILSPDACMTCRTKTENGKKVFKSSDVRKAGYGHVPPFHPNCYCIIIPK